MSSSIDPPTAADIDLWKAYGNALINTFLLGQTLGSTNRFYIPPLNSATIPAGSTITAAQTQFGLSTIGDSLIAIDNPLFVTSGDSYSKRVLDYLYAVQLNQNLSSGLAQVLQDRLNALQAATDAYAKTSKAAVQEYNAFPDPNKGPLTVWASNYYPMLQVAQSNMNAAQVNYEQVQDEINGSGWQGLQDDQNRVSAARNAISPTSYNVQVDSSLLGAEQESGAAPPLLQYMPQYSFGASNEYASVIDGWINVSAEADPAYVSFSFSAADASKYKWSSLGHESSQIVSGGSFWPFFWASYEVDNQTQYNTVHSTSNSSDISVTISAIGIQPFQVQAGNWDPGNVKELYPTLFKNSSKDLGDAMVQVRQIIVGYNVSVTIQLDQNTYNEVISAINTAQKSNSNASASIFGFLINLGGDDSSQSSSSVDYSKMTFDAKTHTITFPGANDTVPVVLGVVGTVVST